MIFKPELVRKVLAGTKTVTRRRIRNGRRPPYKVGHVYAVQPGRGKWHVGHVVVLSVHEEPLMAVGRHEAEAEGFGDGTGLDDPLGEFRDYWRRLHGVFLFDELVVVIGFELWPSELGCCAEMPDGVGS